MVSTFSGERNAPDATLQRDLGSDLGTMHDAGAIGDFRPEERGSLPGELRRRTPRRRRGRRSPARLRARPSRLCRVRSEVNIELNFPPKLRGARSRLYRRRFLQVNTRWKALAEIYTMHSFAPFWNPQSKTGEKRTWPLHRSLISTFFARSFNFSAKTFRPNNCVLFSICAKYTFGSRKCTCRKVCTV